MFLKRSSHKNLENYRYYYINKLLINNSVNCKIFCCLCYDLGESFFSPSNLPHEIVIDLIFSLQLFQLGMSRKDSSFETV